MNREEAQKHFMENYAKEACQEARKVFDKHFKEKREWFCDRLIQAFEELVQQLEEKEELEQMAYFNYSFLQSHVLDGTYQWYLEAQNKEGVLEKKERSIHFDIKELGEPFEELEKNLKREVKKYVGNLTEYDAELLKLKTYKSCISYFYLGGLHGVRNIRENTYYKKLKKYKLFRITLGEYKDACQIIHIGYKEKKQQEEIQKKLYQSVKGSEVDDLQKQELTLQDYSHIVLEEESSRIDCKNLIYSDWRNAKIQSHLFALCNMIGVNFSNAQIEHTSFLGIPFQEADFSGVTMEECDLLGCMFSGEEWEAEKPVTPGVYPISFQNSTLKRVNFSLSDLRGCDFRNATLEDVIFTDAKLKGARIEQHMVSKLNLSEQQRNEIIIE